MQASRKTPTSRSWTTKPDVRGVAVAGARVGGFSLLEVLVVLAITAMVIAVIVPPLSRSSTSELEAAARSLAAGLRLTRSHAAMGNQMAELTVDVTKRQFLLPADARVRALPDDAQLTLFTARSQVEGEDRGSIRFFPDGSSSGGRVTVANDRLAFVVDVDWFTGKVRLIETGPDGRIEVPR